MAKIYFVHFFMGFSNLILTTTLQDGCCHHALFTEDEMQRDQMKG